MPRLGVRRYAVGTIVVPERAARRAVLLCVPFRARRVVPFGGVMRAALLALCCAGCASCVIGDNVSPPDAGAQHVAVGEWCVPDEGTAWCADGAGLCVTGYCVARCGNACAPDTRPTWIPWDGGHLCLCVPE